MKRTHIEIIDTIDARQTQTSSPFACTYRYQQRDWGASEEKNTRTGISTPGDRKGEVKLFYRFLESDLRSDFPRGAEEVFSTFRSDVLAPWLLRYGLRDLAHSKRKRLFAIEA